MEGDEDGSKAPRAGRRAAGRRPLSQDPQAASTATDEEEDSEQQPAADDGQQAAAAGDAETGSRPDVNKQAFNAEGKFAGVSRRKAEQIAKDKEDTSSKDSKYQDADGVETLMEIPELEEEGHEDLTTVVAEAPKLRVHKVQDISELEDTAMFHLPASADRELDFSLLTSCLCSAEQVYEADDVWELEQLFANVACELNLEKEKAENGGKELDSSLIAAAQVDGTRFSE